MSEQTVKQRYLDLFARDFHVDREVMGEHFSGRRMRIDAILTPHNPFEWKSVDVALGIEFKDPEKLKDTKDRTKPLAQSVDYASTRFEGYGYVYVFVCPPMLARNSDGYFEGVADLAMRNFLADLGVGEVVEYRRHGVSLVLKTDHRIWTERDGIASGRHWSLERKFGHR